MFKFIKSLISNNQTQSFKEFNELKRHYSQETNRLLADNANAHLWHQVTSYEQAIYNLAVEIKDLKQQLEEVKK